MGSRRTTLAAVVALTLLFGVPRVGFAEGAVCESKPTGSVMLLILPTDKKVQEYAGTLKHIPHLVRDKSTVVFQDGRVVTSDPGAAGTHLNRLGWADLPLQVVASFGIRPQRRRSFG